MSVKRAESVDELKSVYYLYGDEELLMKESLGRLQNLFAREADPDFNQDDLNAVDVGVERILDSAFTLPMMSTRRLVIARDVDGLSRLDQEKLISYMDRPNPDAILVLVSRFPKPGAQKDSGLKRVENSPLFKKAKSTGEVLKFSMGRQGRRQKLDKWVQQEFKRRGKRIEKPAHDLLLEMVGKEPNDLEDAIERVCLFAADDDTIGEEVVGRVVVPSGEQGIFELIDAVADRRRDISLYMLNRLVRQGETSQKIFSLLLRQFRMIARVKALASEYDTGAIASKLGTPPFVAGKVIRQSKRFSVEHLRRVFLEFKATQLELFSSGYLDEKDYRTSLLENLIFKIIG
jgi:DNA polymerase III subunit delta